MPCFRLGKIMICPADCGEWVRLEPIAGARNSEEKNIAPPPLFKFLYSSFYYFYKENVFSLLLLMVAGRFFGEDFLWFMSMHPL